MLIDCVLARQFDNRVGDCINFVSFEKVKVAGFLRSEAAHSCEIGQIVEPNNMACAFGVDLKRLIGGHNIVFDPNARQLGR